MPDLSVQHVTKSFPTPAEPLVVLREASFELSAGQDVAILGPSGSGKSTLLHILGTLDEPTAGTVSLGGVNPFQLPPLELAAFRNKSIGFIFQDHHLLPQLNVLENVLIPSLANGSPTAGVQERARSLLERVGLGKRLSHRPAELSGGERQRAGVARALLMQPMLLLADEPTGNLDRTNAAAIADLLLQLQKEEQRMLVLVTHSRELADRMQRQLEINDGSLAEVSS
jgi:lipoprotein-releasing system ATP-binding protein